MAKRDDVRVRVPAKINLALRVGPLRPDGFHGLATVFQAVSLTDEVTASPAPEGRITCTATGEGAESLPTGAENLAVRAAYLLRETAGRPDLGCDLSLRKQIPVAGGMAGGSADAAGALLACSVLWDLDTTPDDLADLAAQLGSDVPFALLGGCAFGTNRGDVLVPTLSRGTYHWVLAFAHEGLSTPAVFRRFDEIGTAAEDPPAAPEAVMNALATGDARALGAALVNDLEGPATSLRPDLRTTLDTGLDLGALGAIVSGSGPTVAFLADGESGAVDLSTRLAAAGVARHVRRVAGPVPGARLVG